MSETTAGTETETIPPELRDALDHKIHSGTLELPVLPEVATEVISAASDEECDLRKLSDIIGRDQSMTSHLLRLANSALYATNTPIVSLQQALNRFGLKKIREIALIISCQGQVFRVEGFDDEVRTQFRHSLAAAAFAQEIARLRRWNVEEAFLCGLLHDIGKPVLLQTLVDLDRKLKTNASHEAIYNACNDLHADVGAELVKFWKLPARLSDTIRFHHNPEASETAAQTASMTCLANDFAHYACGPRNVDADELRSHDMVTPLNIYPEEMDGLIDRKDDTMKVVEAIS